MRALNISILVIMLVLSLAACGAGGDDIATLVPTVAAGGTESELSNESPRTDEANTASGVPPTWTPVPTAEPPPPPATPLPDETYVVQPGDTLAELAEEFGVGLDALVQANNIQNIDIIEVGQVLIIPR